MTERLNKIVDSTQRRLRVAANIRWSEKTSNEDLYTLLQYENWSTTIKRKRLNFVGYMLRQKPDTPVRKSLAEAPRAVRKSGGVPRKTWYSLIKKNCKRLKIKIEDESTWGTVLDRSQWKRRVSQPTSTLRKALKIEG